MSVTVRSSKVACKPEVDEGEGEEGRVLGRIIPGPLSIPAIACSLSWILNVLARGFGNISIIVNALVNFSQSPNPPPPSSPLMVYAIFLMRGVWPITPVRTTSVEDWEFGWGGTSNPSVDFTVAQASTDPCVPVTVFALPLHDHPLALPPFLPSTSWPTSTNAALNVFRVDEAEEEVCRPRSTGLRPNPTPSTFLLGAVRQPPCTLPEKDRSTELGF